MLACRSRREVGRLGRKAERSVLHRTAARPHGPFDEDGWAKVFSRIKRRGGVRGFSAHILRHTWATNFMKAEGANLLELKRQGGWERWEVVERYSHAVPVKDRRSLPNPLASQKTAFGQLPSARISLRAIG